MDSIQIIQGNASNIFEIVERSRQKPSQIQCISWREREREKYW